MNRLAASESVSPTAQKMKKPHFKKLDDNTLAGELLTLTCVILFLVLVGRLLIVGLRYLQIDVG
jgi:hypothetical protein